jgi:hypothetical protein
MKMYGRVYVQIDVFLTGALFSGEWLASRPCRSTPWERAHAARWIGGRVGPRAGRDNIEKLTILTLPGHELRPLVRRALSAAPWFNQLNLKKIKIKNK